MSQLPTPDTVEPLCLAIVKALRANGNMNPLVAVTALLNVLKEMGVVLREQDAPQFMMDAIAKVTVRVAEHIRTGGDDFDPTPMGPDVN